MSLLRVVSSIGFDVDNSARWTTTVLLIANLILAQRLLYASKRPHVAA